MKECPKCNGFGYYAGHDLPNRHGEDGECVNCPVQVPCEICDGTGEIAPELNLNPNDNTDTFNDIPF